MSKFVSNAIGGPNDGQQIVSSPWAPRDGDIQYVPIRISCLLPGQSVATERKHVYRYQHGKGWVYQGVE